MKKCEYYILRLIKKRSVFDKSLEILLEDGAKYPFDELSAVFSQLGEQGWELVTASDYTLAPGVTEAIMYFFKREL